jgi:hypothetical protein
MTSLNKSFSLRASITVDLTWLNQTTMMQRQFLRQIWSLGIATAIGMGTLNGATVLIDWSTATSLTTDGDGNHWNSLGSNPVDSGNVNGASLVDSTGAATGVTVSVQTDFSTAQGWGGFDGTSGPDPFDEAAVSGDAMFNGTDTQVIPITFQGLLANTEYVFTAVNRRTTNNRDGKITLTTGTSTNLGAGVLAQNSTLTFNVTSSASGVIAFGFAENTSGAGGTVMNGLSITGTFVPEPGSTSLLALGVAAMLCRRRRA